MNDDNALMEIIEPSSMMPLMSIEAATERYSQVAKFVTRIMKKDKDFGIIPGTDKQTLYKPGAEKLTTFFGLTKRFQIIGKVEDWMGQDHGGEPFFYYLYHCQLSRGDLLIAESDGSCNSFESKYRYRKSERVCPNCNKPAIIKGKAEYGGGWICWKQKDGCGAKFGDGTPSIEQQETGKVVNPDICDQVNTFQKMAQKRALVAATLLAVNASDFFTQDVEDYIVSDDKPSPPKEEKRPASKPKVDQSTGEVTPTQTAGFEKEAKPKSRNYIDDIYEEVQERTANHYEHKKHLYQFLGKRWPNEKDEEAIQKAIKAAVSHVSNKLDTEAAKNG